MTEIPSWWIYISGAFFVINCLFFLALTIGVFMLLKVVTELKPKIDSLETSVQGLIVKVSAVTEKVDAVVASVQQTIDSVGTRARGVAGTAEMVSSLAGRQFERFSPLVVGALTAMRIFKGINEIRSTRRRDPDSDEPPRRKKKGILSIFLG